MPSAHQLEARHRHHGMHFEVEGDVAGCPREESPAPTDHVGHAANHLRLAHYEPRQRGRIPVSLLQLRALGDWSRFPRLTNAWGSM